MPLPLIPVNALAIPTGTAHFTLTAGILSTDSAMTLTDGSVAASTLPLYGNVRLLVYKTGDTNPEYVDMTSRSGAVLQISRQTEESTLRPKCDHAIGASVWIVQTADMVVQHVTVGAPVLLEEHIASASAQLDFTQITDDYDEYMIELISIKPSVDGGTLQLRIGTGATPTYDTGANYDWVYTRVNTSGTGFSSGHLNDTVIGLIEGISNSNTGQGTYRAYDLKSLTVNKRFIGDIVVTQNDGTFYRAMYGSQWKTPGTAVTALRFFMSSGNITSGVIRLYGISKTIDANALTTEAYAVIQDQKTTGTSGGTFNSGAWRTRDLNTIVVDTNGIVTALAANQFTLNPGRYQIFSTAPGFNVNGHQIRLQNITDAVTQIHGFTAYANGVNTPAILFGEFIITASKVFEIQHQCDTTNAVGFGAADSGWAAHEAYASVQIRRIGGKIASGDVVLLATKNASAVATLDFDCITSAFDEYLIEFVNLVPATNNVDILFRLSKNHGATFEVTNYEYVTLNNSTSNAGIDSSVSTSATAIQLFPAVDNSQSYGVSGSIKLYDPLNTTLKKSLMFDLSATFQPTARRYLQRGSGFWGDVSAVNAFRFLFSSGNITSGTVRVYGLAK